MSAADPKAQAIEGRVTIRTMGILNVVFSLALLAAGLCQGFWAISIPMIGMAIERQQKREAEASAARASQVAESRKAEDLAAPAQKPGIADAREEMEAESGAEVDHAPAISTAPLRDPRLVGHFLFDLGSGVLLNGLMLVSGIGLLYSRPWGRTLALGVAWLKLLRLAALAGSAAFLLAPFVQAAFAQMEIQAFPDDPRIQVEAPEDGAAVAAMTRAYGLGLLVLGSIYPAATLRALGRREVGDVLRARHQLD